MNDEVQDRKFEELLSATLSDYVDEEPRLGLDQRILASLTPERGLGHWVLWGCFTVATAATILMANVSLHHRAALPQNPELAAKAPTTSAPRSANPQIAGEQRELHRRAERPEIAIAVSPAGNAYPFASPRAQADGQDQRTAEDPDATGRGEAKLKIQPLKISPIVVQDTEEALSNLEPKPLKVAPITFAAIEIRPLDTETKKSNP